MGTVLSLCVHECYRLFCWFFLNLGRMSNKARVSSNTREAPDFTACKQQKRKADFALARSDQRFFIRPEKILTLLHAKYQY